MTEIEYSDFQKLEIKVGEIIKVENHPNADRLYKLKVSLGEKEIQVIAGIKKFYSEEELMNRKVIVLTNLKEAKLRGEVSQGMLLGAEESEDKYVLLCPEKDVARGSQIL